MHREISHTDPNQSQESPLTLYLFTGLLGLLLTADLWPVLVRWLTPWLSGWDVSLPTWPNEIGGYRLALLAAVIGGARTLYGSLDALFAGRVGADLALAIACVAAILLREPLVAAEVVFIGMLGECLEGFTFERTQRALRGLVQLRPRRCWRLRDGQEERVLTTELQVGDVIFVKPGGRVPADGVVRDGRSTVDVSPLTGESVPVDKGPGDEVLAGSLNQTGALTIEAQRVANETVVARVIELTSQALLDKAPLERTADRLARYFLPAVLILAAVTFLGGLVFYGSGWFRSVDSPRLGLADAARLSLYPTLSVLVVACPCALILATPAAVIAALGRLAGTGILVKRGSALERLAQVKVFAFDKTGTLTEGQLQLGEIVPLGNITPDELLRIVASAEQSSEHVLARLILAEASKRGLQLEPVSDFQAHPGCGVSGRMRDRSRHVLVGNRRLLLEQGLPLSPEVDAVLDRLDEAGQTVLLVAVDGVIQGAIGASDRIRPEAPGVLADLRRLGIERLAILTGDRTAVARAVAGQLETEATKGLIEVHAELLPHQKAEWVALASRERQRPEPGAADQSQVSLPGSSEQITTLDHAAPAAPAPVANAPGSPRVAMVGDGINDAPALARADVGLALAGGGLADLAAEAGDIVFMGDPLRHLPLLVRLSRETVRIIHQNILFFAFGVNVVGILLTSWLWPILLPASWYEQGPVAAVVYHQLGSLIVLLNSMRLLWFERGSSSTMIGMRRRIEGINAWLERWLNIEEGLHQLLHHWREAILAGGALLLAGWGLSGLTVIGPDEVGLVQRWGRLVSDDLKPGLHYCWPYPVETVTRIQPDRVMTLEIGYRLSGRGGFQGARAWSSAHGQDGVRRNADEAVMITGDGNLIELQAAVRYRIAQPRTWLFEVRDGQALLRSATESVLRETVASHTFSDLLTTGRAAFQNEVLDRLRQRVEGYSSAGLGIQLEGLLIDDLHPPQEVVAAYHEVTKAMEQRDRRINQAEAVALAQEKNAEAQKLKTIREAQAESKEVLDKTQAQADAFRTRWQVRSRLSWQVELRLLGQAVLRHLEGQPAQEIVRNWDNQRQTALGLQTQLTDFRLFWEMLSSTLAGRDKVIVDSERVPGRRNLWLIPPDMLRPPPLMLPPRGGDREERLPLGQREAREP